MGDADRSPAAQRPKEERRERGRERETTYNNSYAYLLFAVRAGVGRWEMEWRERFRRSSRTEASTLSGAPVATGHTKKREDDVVLLLYVVSLSTALAPLVNVRSQLFPQGSRWGGA